LIFQTSSRLHAEALSDGTHARKAGLPISLTIHFPGADPKSPFPTANLEFRLQNPVNAVGLLSK
jgi:hypothetical protein